MWRNLAVPPLAPRYRGAVNLLLEGLSNKEIAHRLGLSYGTVKVYLCHAYAALGVGSRNELLAKQINALRDELGARRSS